MRAWVSAAASWEAAPQASAALGGWGGDLHVVLGSIALLVDPQANLGSSADLGRGNPGQACS